MLEDVCVRGTVTALLLLTSVINLSGRSDPGTCVCVCGGGAVDIQRCCICCSVELQQVHYAVRRERSDGDSCQDVH